MKFVSIVGAILLVTPPAFAQAGPNSSPTLNAERRSEQALPRNVVPFDPAHFDKYVGYYQLGPSTIFTVIRDGDHFFARLTGQVNVEFFPESDTKFFATVVHAQISFNTDGQGQVTELVLHQNGLEQNAPRITEPNAKGIEAALLERVRANQASPGTEVALKHQIESMEEGHRDYSALTPTFASAIKEAEPAILASLSSMGSLKSIKFRSVTVGGMDTYQVEFERGSTQWFITPLTTDGKIAGMSWRRAP
jgi:Domain of unknown function (DUF3471)